MGLHVTIDPAAPTRAAPAARRRRGRLAQLSGVMAEDAVLRHYLRRGAQLMASRWRGAGAEIDLILRDGPDLVFVEVKKAASHALAAERLGAAQMARICRAACLYCEDQGLGSLTSMRFDAALVDGHGRVDIIANAFGEV